MTTISILTVMELRFVMIYVLANTLILLHGTVTISMKIITIMNRTIMQGLEDRISTTEEDIQDSVNTIDLLPIKEEGTQTLQIILPHIDLLLNLFSNLLEVQIESTDIYLFIY